MRARLKRLLCGHHDLTRVWGRKTELGFRFELYRECNRCGKRWPRQRFTDRYVDKETT